MDCGLKIMIKKKNILSNKIILITVRTVITFSLCDMSHISIQDVPRQEKEIRRKKEKDQQGRGETIEIISRPINSELIRRELQGVAG